MPVYDFDPPARFVAGAVGPPGMRTFFLQARDDRRLVSVSCEKEQLAAVADRLLDLLDELSEAAGSEASAAPYADDGPLETPIEDEFRVTTVSLGWDGERQIVLIEASRDPVEDADDSLDDSGEDSSRDAAGLGPAGSGGPEDSEMAPTELLRVALPPAHARAFARRAQAVVSAGRPPCPFCGGPLDPNGHVCPRANGYRR